MFISAEWTGFITPQNEYYNLFSSQSSGSVLLKMLLLVVMHTLALVPGDSTAVPAPGLGCVRVRTGWCLWEGDQGGTETDSFWIRTVILPYPAHALNRVLKQQCELGNMQSSTSLSIQLLCSFLQPEFGDFLSMKCISNTSFNCHYLSSINLSNLSMNLFIFQFS